MEGGAIWNDLFASPELTLVRADYSPRLFQQRHAHDYVSLSLLLTGAVEETVGSRVVEAGPLSVVVKRDGVDHACLWGLEGARMLSVEIPPVSLEDRTETGLAPWMTERNPAPVRAVLALYQSWRNGRLAAEADDLLLELLATMTAQTPVEGRTRNPPGWMSSAVEEIRDASPRRPSTRRMAEQAGVHPVHFARVFRQHVGMSPTTFARWLRVQSAASTVGEGAPSAAGAALGCGFADQSHLCREFKTWVSVTPSVFHRLARPVGS